MDQLQAIMEAVPREEKRVKSRPHSIATSNHENGAHGPTAEDEETHTPIDLSVSGSGKKCVRTLCALVRYSHPVVYKTRQKTIAIA